jgi:hypothetical protein
MMLQEVEDLSFDEFAIRRRVTDENLGHRIASATAQQAGLVGKDQLNMDQHRSS